MEKIKEFIKNLPKKYRIDFVNYSSVSALDNGQHLMFGDDGRYTVVDCCLETANQCFIEYEVNKAFDICEYLKKTYKGFVAIGSNFYNFDNVTKLNDVNNFVLCQTLEISKNSQPTKNYKFAKFCKFDYNGNIVL